MSKTTTYQMWFSVNSTHKNCRFFSPHPFRFCPFHKSSAFTSLSLKEMCFHSLRSSHAHVACRPGTIFFGSFGPRALKNTHSNYSTSVLVHFFSPPPSLKPCRQSLLTSASLLAKFCPNAKFAMLQHLTCGAESFLFVSQFVCVWVCVYVCAHGLAPSLCACASWD